MNLFNDYEKRGEILIIAGDLSHSNKLSFNFLCEISKHYKMIFFTPGNHDYYLTSKTMLNKYKTSRARVSELFEMILKLDNVVALNGATYNYKNIVIGGAVAGWTNDYIKNKPFVNVGKLYSETMNDYNYITESKLINKQNIKSLNNIVECSDIIVTHYSPLIDDRFIDEEYQNNDISTFYTFDGRKYFDNRFKVWIFGHIHNKINTKIYNKNFLCNPLGYPHEKNNVKIMGFEL